MKISLMKMYIYAFVLFSVFWVVFWWYSMADTGDVVDTTEQEAIEDSSIVVSSSENVSPVDFLQKYLASDIPMTDLHRTFVAAITEKLQEYSPSQQWEILGKLIRRLKSYTKVYRVTWLDKDKLLTVLEFTLDISTKTSWSMSSSFLWWDFGTDVIKYQLFPAKEEGKQVVVFRLESPRQIRRATRHRPDGSTYTCTMDKCKQIPQVWETDKSYQVVVYINYGYEESSREVLEVNINKNDLLQDSSSVQVSENVRKETKDISEAWDNTLENQEVIETKNLDEVFSPWNFSYDIDTDNINKKIFKIKSYTKDKILDNFIYSSYGSAVLIWEDTLITNAHVILWDNESPGWLYEVCKTQQEDKDPSCFTTASLLYYDQQVDLALLKLPQKVNVHPVHLNKDDQQMWYQANILWYPSNGWGTITLTKWTISWVSKGNYKIDANLDGGNSWWGWFDKDNRLIGIPTYVVQWYTTLWYMIPTSKMLDFLYKKGDIVEYTWIQDVDFTTFLDQLHLANADIIKIDHPLFSVSNMDAYGFHLNHAMLWSDNIAKYDVTNDDESVNISINVGGKYWWVFPKDIAADLDKAYEEYLKGDIKEYTTETRKKSNGDEVKIEKVIFKNNLMIIGIDDALSNESVTFTIFGKEGSSSVEKAIDLYLHEFVVKNNERISLWNLVHIGALSFDVWANLFVYKEISLFGGYSFSFKFPLGVYHDGGISIHVLDKQGISDSIYDDLTKDNPLTQMLREDDDTFEEEEGVTKKWEEYYYFDTKNDDTTRMRIYTFVIDRGNDTDYIEIYMISLDYDVNDKDIVLSYFNKFLDSINLEGNFPF